MKAYFLQRIISYLVDLFIITLAVSIITFFIPTSEAYNNAIKESSEASSSYIAGDIDSDEYIRIYGETNYTIAHESVIFTVVNLLVIVAYFGTYSYYNNGQTLGKKLMKIKISTIDGKNPGHFTLILRTIVIYGVITNVLSLLMLPFITADMYIYTIGSLEFIQSIFVFVTILMVMFRKDGRGLHDFISNTKVVTIK